MTPKQVPADEGSEQAQFIEPNTHSFILKVWLEDEVDDTKIWRGYLTHVASGQRVYFKNLLEMNNHLTPHLKRIGFPLPFWWRAYQWLTK
ncbi:MAG: hypothetical protein KC413_10125 [Anaerolineales bacterium]|nr:hypothetical protein [Anaerolineales bacterium]